MMYLAQARKTAARIEEILSPHCTRFHIAGSVRRGRSMVKDIEVVCLPKRVLQQTELFGDGEPVISKDFVEGIAQMTSRIVRGNVNGRHMEIILKGGKTMDLFMPEEKDYFRQLVIRTGSSEYVHNIIAAAWKKLGWCGTTNLGLRRIEDCVKSPAGQGKTSWKCINARGETPPVWQSEQEFYSWLKLTYIPPNEREFKPVLNPSL